MPSSLRWPDAALAGLACSMRSMSGPAVLAARGVVGGRARAALLVAGVGELGADKSPWVPDRTSPPALLGRLGTGAWTGYEVAGPVGAGVAALSAAAGTFSTWRLRKLLVDTTPLSDPLVAAIEDIVCYGLAALATQAVESGEPRDAVEVAQVASAVGSAPRRPAVGLTALQGLGAGVAGTAAMTLAQGAEYVLTRAEPSDAPVKVADKVSRRLGRGRIRRRRRASANQGMHWLYGSAWGIPYGLFAANSRLRPELTGPAFGLIVWAVGLAEQPALGVADPPWERSLKSLGAEAFFHLVYGAGAAAALRAVRNV